MLKDDPVLARVIHPYWTPHPLKCCWRDTKGPSGFLAVNELQQFVNVGLFNLSWLLLDTDYDRLRTALDKAIIDRVIFVLQSMRWGKQTLNEAAALHTLPEFYELAVKHKHGELIAACESRLEVPDGLSTTKAELPTTIHPVGDTGAGHTEPAKVTKGPTRPSGWLREDGDSDLCSAGT